MNADRTLTSSGASNMPQSSSPAPALSAVPTFYEIRHRHSAHSKTISALKFSPAGDVLASASADTTVQLHAINTATSSLTTKATLNDLHDGGLNDTVWSHDANNLFTASDDRTIGVWDAHTAAALRQLKGHTHHVFALTHSPLSSLLVSGSYDETVKVWDIRANKTVRTIVAHSEAVTSVDFTRDGQSIISSSYDGLCRVWDLASGRCLKTIFIDKPPPLSPLAHVRLTPNGKYILAAYLDDTMRLWDYTNMTNTKPIKTYRGHNNKTYCIIPAFVVTHHNKYICSGSEDGRIVIWDIQKSAIVQNIIVDNDTTTTTDKPTFVPLCVAAHPSRHMLVAGGIEKEPAIRIFTDEQSPYAPIVQQPPTTTTAQQATT